MVTPGIKREKVSTTLPKLQCYFLASSLVLSHLYFLVKQLRIRLISFHFLGGVGPSQLWKGKISAECMLFAFLQKYLTRKSRVLCNFANHMLY